MLNKIAMQRPKSWVIYLPLNYNIAGILRISITELVAIAALGIRRVNYHANPFSPPFRQNPKGGCTMEMHVVGEIQMIDPSLTDNPLIEIMSLANDHYGS